MPLPCLGTIVGKARIEADFQNRPLSFNLVSDLTWKRIDAGQGEEPGGPTETLRWFEGSMTDLSDYRKEDGFLRCSLESLSFQNKALIAGQKEI